MNRAPKELGAQLHQAVAPVRTNALAGALTFAGLALGAPVVLGQQGAPGGPPEIVVHVSELPKNNLYELETWNEASAAGGKMLGVANRGDYLDPPPENDPHVAFKARVQRGVPYRLWVHMKVGKPKGVAKANLLFAQFTDAVDKDNKEVYKPGTASYVALRGPASEGWTWVGRDLADPKSSEPQIYFRTSGEVTVRLQAGMEGVGFDQVVLSPARFLEKPPAEAVVAKAK